MAGPDPGVATPHVDKETRTYGTMTADLLELLDWLVTVSSTRRARLAARTPAALI